MSVIIEVKGLVSLKYGVSQMAERKSCFGNYLNRRTDNEDQTIVLY